jgi:hypothetical protein
MKKTLLVGLLAFCCTGILSAQEKNAITQHLQNELANHKLQHIQLFALDDAAAPNDAVEQDIKNPTYLRLNVAALQELMTTDKPFISFDLPISSTETLPVVLGAYDIFAEGFKVYENRNEQKTEINYTPGKHFRGYIGGKELSLAAFSFYKDEVGAIFSTVDGGNYNLTLNLNNPGANKEHYLLFPESSLVNQQLRPECQVRGDNMKVESGHDNQPAQRSYATCKVVTVSLYADFKLFTLRSSNATTTANFMTTLFNGVATLYANERIYAAIADITVNTAADGYNYTSSKRCLDTFGKRVQDNHAGNLAHLLSGDNSGLGGVAWLDALCDSYYFIAGSGHYGPYAFSGLGTATNTNFTTYSWGVECATHEMGHNLGSPHTHACSWNGNNTAIDGCAPTYDVGLKEGSCAIGPDRKSVV